MKFSRTRYGIDFNDFIEHTSTKLRVCIYCKCWIERPSREHVPSRVFFNKPYPNPYPTLPACFKCNNSYSDSEQYLVCLIESIKEKFIDSYKVNNKIKITLERKPKLRNRIQNKIDKKSGKYKGNGHSISKVLEKLLLGHWAYETSDTTKNVLQINYKFSYEMSELDFQKFNDVSAIYHINNIYTLPELGSLLFQSFFILTTKNKPLAVLYDKWFVMKENEYRYCIDENLSRPTVKIVISDFLFCEVQLSNDYIDNNISIPETFYPYSHVPELECSYQEASAPLPELPDNKSFGIIERKGVTYMEKKKRGAPPKYDEAFKAGAVKMVTESNRSVKEVAAQLGICRETLVSWLKKVGISSSPRQENAQLKRLKELEIENKALKKALADEKGEHIMMFFVGIRQRTTSLRLGEKNPSEYS